MLPASARLTEREAFREVTRRGRKSSRPGMVVYLLPQAEPSAADTPPPRSPSPPRPPQATRVGFVVGRRVGPATVRNLVRRRLRHLMAARCGQLDAGTSVVVRALPPSAEMTYQQLAVQLDECLARVQRQRQTRRRSR